MSLPMSELEILQENISSKVRFGVYTTLYMMALDGRISSTGSAPVISIADSARCNRHITWVILHMPDTIAN